MKNNKAKQLNLFEQQEPVCYKMTTVVSNGVIYRCWHYKDAIGNYGYRWEVSKENESPF